MHDSRKAEKAGIPLFSPNENMLLEYRVDQFNAGFLKG
jgi:hypothetical protein